MFYFIFLKIVGWYWFLLNKLGFLQLVICNLVTTTCCNKSVENLQQTCCQKAFASHAYASDIIATSCQQTFCNLCVLAVVDSDSCNSTF